MVSLLGPEQRLVSSEIILKGIEDLEKSVDKPNWSLNGFFKNMLKMAKDVPIWLVPFISPGAKILDNLWEMLKKQPTLEDSIATVSLEAYLKSYKYFLNKENRLLSCIESNPVSESFKQQIKQLDMLVLEYEETSKAAEHCFHESKLAKHFGTVLLKRLQDAGLEKKEADIWTKRVAWNTPRYLFQSWTESFETETIKSQTQQFSSKWKQEQQLYRSVEDYLRKQIANKLDDKVFDEKFTFKDIYVPLRAKKVDEYGKVDKRSESFDLENWAINLLDTANSNRVMFVQAGPGRGKSLFCRMFANWVRTHRYPFWIPVLIRLREIKTLHTKFEDTLQEAVSEDFASNGWLRNRHTKYLFLLDGFDELLLEGRTSSGLKDFLKKVAAFQQDSHEKYMGHRVLITGRTLALQGIELQMPKNMKRVGIEVMNYSLQQQWLDKWEKHVGTQKANAFQDFVQDERCPKEVQELAREPLLLYLLATLHRYEELQGSDFEGASDTNAKIRIYQKSLEWVLTKQRDLNGQEIKGLRRILTEAGLCVTQSRREFVSVKAIEYRLTQDEEARELLEKARKRDEDNPLRNELAMFYLRKGSQEGSVEFVHKSFGEFLCAECIKEGLEAWTASEQQPWPIYDLLGCEGLTPEIVEYLMGLLTASENFDPVQLFDRLSAFYYRWGKGELIDTEEPEILPLRKMRQLQEQGIKQGQRRVDVYAGLNVMIILLELHRYARDKDELKESISFHPCGTRNSQGEPDDPTLLFRIIGYSRCIGDTGFCDIVGAKLMSADLRRAKLMSADLRRAKLMSADLRDTNLSRADLSGADLSGADLSGANLCRADLSGAKLMSADLSGAKLMSADLRRANLCRAVLRRAVLSDADLSDADLSEAVLSGAKLSGAKLMSADLRRADLSATELMSAVLSGTVLSDEIFGDVRWDRHTKWDKVRGLDTAVNMPEALKQQLGL